VPRFSTVAVAAVAALVVAGAVNGYEQVGTWSGLWETRYGKLLLLKIAIVAPLLALGAFNNRYAVPRLRRGLTIAAERRRFSRALGAELVLVAAVVGVTAVLVAAPPARTSVAPADAPFSTTAPVGQVEASIVVQPATAGTNTIHLALLDRDGRPALDSRIEEVSATLPTREIGPLQLQIAPAGPGHVIIPRANMTVPGTWLLRLVVATGELDEDIQTVPVPTGERQ
jgi:copper transport protein